MITWNELTTLGRTVVATLAALALLLLMGVAGAIETQGATATNAECDAMYHAIWKVKQEPSHSTLISIATNMNCPFND